MSSNQMGEQIREVKQLTSNFGINLFVPQEFSATGNEIDKTTKLLNPIFKKLDIQQDNVVIPSFKGNYESFKEKLEIIVEEGVPVCSFIFGIPPKEWITKLKDNGIIVIGTATPVHEAVEIEKAGLDAVVVALAQPIVSASKSQNNSEYMRLLSGHSPRLAKQETAQVLIENIIAEAKQINRDL